MRFLVSLLITGALFAQQPPPTEPAKPRRMPEPKNLQVLKVTPAELIPLMRSYNASLGVQCTFCHVQGNFASDENPHKATARMMIGMTQEINAKFTDGKVRVSCFTCHRGEEMPQLTPPAAPPAKPAPPPPPPPAP